MTALRDLIIFCSFFNFLDKFQLLHRFDVLLKNKESLFSNFLIVECIPYFISFRVMTCMASCHTV
ncbi:hypothetical protein D3C87_1750690 [compost metagenome]